MNWAMNLINLSINLFWWGLQVLSEPTKITDDIYISVS